MRHPFQKRNSTGAKEHVEIVAQAGISDSKLENLQKEERLDWSAHCAEQTIRILETMNNGRNFITLTIINFYFDSLLFEFCI